MARLNSSWAPAELWGHLSSQPQEKCKGSRPAPTGRRKFRWSCHRAHDPVHLGAHSRIAGWEPEDRGLPTGGQVEDTAFILVTSESGRLRALRLCAPGAPRPPGTRDPARDNCPRAPAPLTSQSLPTAVTCLCPCAHQRCQPSRIPVLVRKPPGPESQPCRIPYVPSAISQPRRPCPAPARTPEPTHGGGSEGFLRLASDESSREDFFLKVLLL